MTDRLQSSVPPEILFIERCTQFLVPGGRLGIVLPDSILGSPGLGYIREWLIQNHRIIASIDLHVDTFQPRNGTQTSVLFLQKKTQMQKDAEEKSGQMADYNIFMAMVEKIGHDKRGNPLFKRDKEGNEILVPDKNNVLVLGETGEGTKTVAHEQKVKVEDDQTPEVPAIFAEWKVQEGVVMVSGNVAYALQEDVLHEIEVAESPVKFCTVTLSDVISRGKRLEASVFDVEAKHARAAVEHGKYPVTMVGGTDGLASSYVCGRFKRIWLDKSDLPIYQPSSITDIYPTPDGYISHKTQTNIEALRVHAGQVLMTCSGTIGKLSFVSKTLNNKIFSHDLLRIDANSPEDAGYIYAYLKSSTGNRILLTNSYGAVITHIEPEHLATVPIPNAPVDIKGRINDLIVGSYELRDASNALIDEATALLVKELQLPDIRDFDVALYKKDTSVDTFNVKMSNLAGRVDASYHVPIVNAIVDHMKQYAAEVTTVGDERISKRVILPPRFARVYVEEGYGSVLIGGKQIYELDPSGKKYLSKAKHKALMEKLEVEQNTILITRSGTIGKVVLVPKHWEHWIPSDHIIRVVPASKDIAGYLSIFLASEYGYQLITHYTYGSVVDEIDDTHVSSIPFPILKDEHVQQQINDLALEANEKRYEAYKMEQRALRIVDEEVIYAK